MKTHTCTHCHTTFQNWRSSAKYCSRQCSGAAKKGTERPALQRRVTLICEYCQKPFVRGGTAGQVKGARFCSQSCVGAARRHEKTCEHCGQPFHRRGGVGRFCSRACAVAATHFGEPERDYACDRCGKTFRAAPSQRRGKKKYCSGECRAAGRVYTNGVDHPQWKGGTYINTNGHLYEIDRSQPTKADGSARYIAQHVRVVEEKLGRKLAKGEHVHHLNGVKMDNRPENLIVVSNSMHHRLHGFYSAQFQQEHAEKGDLAAITQTFIDAND